MPIGYPSIELGLPGKPACPDAFTAGSSIECGGARKLRIQSSLAAIVVQFGVGVGGVEWGPEQTFYPTVGSIVKRFDAIRVRNLVAGQAAQVILTPDQ